MISVSVPSLHLAGGTDEEWSLHRRALEQYAKMPVRQDSASTVQFETVLANMHAEHAKIAQDAYAAADSMWAAI